MGLRSLKKDFVPQEFARRDADGVLIARTRWPKPRLATPVRRNGYAEVMCLPRATPLCSLS
eukprot:10281920-Prorocentrum_lima.AAC.1